MTPADDTIDDTAADTAGAPRPRRADARRNRKRLVDVARAVFAADGPGASLNEIARRAGVGPGTLYRHFPHPAGPAGGGAARPDRDAVRPGGRAGGHPPAR